MSRNRKTARSTTILGEMLARTGLSYMDLARKFGVANQTIRRWVETDIIPSYSVRQELRKMAEDYHNFLTPEELDTLDRIAGDHRAQLRNKRRETALRTRWGSSTED
jgi:transposase-like protein